MIEAVAWLLLAWHKEGGFVKVRFEDEYACDRAQEKVIAPHDWNAIQAVCIEVPAAQGDE